MSEPGNGKALAVREAGAALPARLERTVEEVVEQVKKIQACMTAVMQEGVHYGVIPGTDKPTLYKAGAEKLCLLFRLDPQYELVRETKRDDFIEYVVRCVLWHIPTGERVASGMGSCNSREAKYRYRYVATDGRPSKEEAAKLKALGLGRWRKADGAWVWMERVEHDNPADYDNTILKMACKRAKVAAVLDGTAASDCFTQDVEDLPDFASDEEPTPQGPAPSPRPGRAEGTSDAAAPAPPAREPRPCTRAQIGRYMALRRELGLSADRESILRELSVRLRREITSREDVSFDEFEALNADLAGLVAERRQAEAGGER